MSASSSVADVDAWISQLQDCKQLSESDIKKLCDKVKKKKIKFKKKTFNYLNYTTQRRVKFLCKNPMYSQSIVQ